MEDQKLRTPSDSINATKDLWSKELSEIRSLLKELVGEVATVRPQNRDLVKENRDLVKENRDPSLPMESESLKIPRFSGDDPAAWVFQVEQYFTHYNIFSDHKLSLASLFLDGEALDWYCWLFRNKQLADWEHFVTKLFIRFRNRSREAPNRRLALLRQLTTVTYCSARAATTPSWSTMAKYPSPQYWNVGYGHNNQTFAHKVFGEKLDRVTEKVVDVDTMLQTPDALKPEGEYKDIPAQIKSEGAEILISGAKQEICNSKEISNSDLDDNEENPLPLVLAVADTNVQGGQPLQITETGAEVVENKAQDLFGIYPPKAGQQFFFDNEVADSFWERSDPLILDGTRLMNNHIFIHFPFDPGESVPSSILFENLDIHSDISHYLSIALYSYSSIFVLNGTMKGAKWFNEISSSKVGIQTSKPRLPQPLPKLPFDFDGLVIIGGVDSKIKARVVAANFSSKLQPAAAVVAAMLQGWKVLQLRSENTTTMLKYCFDYFAGLRSSEEQLVEVHEGLNTHVISGGVACVIHLGIVLSLWLYSNLEDKVLFEGGSIVVNQDNCERVYGLDMQNKIDPAIIIGPSKILESFIWDPGPISYC